MSTSLISSLAGSSSSDTSSTLLSMLNSSKKNSNSSVDSILSANISANRERINCIIEKATGVSASEDTSAYETVSKDVSNLQKYLSALQEDDLYEEDSETVYAMVEKFASYYNTLATDMDTLGGTVEKTYGARLEALGTTKKDTLAQIGITIDDKGKLTVDEEKLKAADLDTIKSVFTTDGSYGASSKNILSEEAEILTQALKIKATQTNNYSSSGSYLSQIISSTLNTTA